MKTGTSFRELLAEGDVEIPMLQRDYAQGRRDEHSVQVRHAFLKALFDALSGASPSPLVEAREHETRV